MSIQFSRTMRSLSLDSFRVSRFAMILASVLGVAMIAWFFMAKVTMYETTSQLELTEGGRVLASFTPEAAARIQPGQAAILRLLPASNQPVVSIPAVVFDAQPGSDQVELLLMTNELPPAATTNGLKGQVEVEVEYITPVSLVMRASGKYLKNPNLPMSPQSFEGSEK